MKIGPLDPVHRDAAARLFWQANEAQLTRVLGPEEKAVAAIAPAIDPAFALAATQADRLLGVLGYREARGAWVRLGQFDLGAYGMGRFWRRAALASIPSDSETALVIDTLAVVPGHRGAGIGTALVRALPRLAATQGHDRLRIDVAPQNTRARALYERMGFAAGPPQSMGPLWPLFGTRHRIPMRRPVAHIPSGGASPPA
ncbi:GNAT family N-acetyltransferase [Salipiger sp. IMCC34102]|uniref:GNAT family N-acetyltransferase n=1 Tax=Salipiger sp. IMCC34102 TaxID=2510647 RepID=UPI00101BA0C0|nr:GNAT family N-acetyltransferase [Salipiger sp. IMCC34102]RYH01641.1 GNAT family N-acetyltransferase [Salipiger sp. IMCC34102]